MLLDHALKRQAIRVKPASLFDSFTTRMRFFKSCDDCLQSIICAKFVFIKHISQLCPRVIVRQSCTDVAIILAYANTLSFSQPPHLAC
ncbi:hypothetical protein PSA3335_02965 [Pseudomonas savastanoi pv. savastanoi NCPPB 3335]|uniref:Uncharacterized protein n=1 Tax=Pseudomonas savastanoi pv. savastanoi NCPPB 3335 TaxID=693985 RepID=A0ABC8B839_PSESS|nr:hypothetical protein PSA3335_02965 [Pseudomonas savastanoi pv. savastanoi NCPPB 3335]